MFNWVKKKQEPAKNWSTNLQTYSLLTDSQKILVSLYDTNESLLSVLGTDHSYFINSRYKLYLNEIVLAVEHFILTGEVKYFYTHRQADVDLKAENAALKVLLREYMKEIRNESC